MKGISKKKKILISVAVIVLLIAGYFAYAYFVPQHIYLEEIRKEVIIDKHFRSIALEVSGVETKVGITKDTKITSLTLLGVKNIVYLCEGIHNPEMENKGLNDNVYFINCSDAN